MSVGFWTFEKVSNREENSCGSSRIRARWVYKYWHGAEEAQIGKKYDAVIFQKAYWPQMIFDATGFIKIFDECDPAWLEGRGDDVFKYYDACDAVTTSTQALADYIKKMLPDKIVECVPDRVDLEEHKKMKVDHADKITDVAWFGYSHNFKYLLPALPILEKQGVKLTIYSDTGVEVSGGNAKPVWKKYHYPSLHSDLIKHDAVILPQDRGKVDPRGQFKSNNKQLTCCALGIPVLEGVEDFKRLETKAAREKEAKEKRQLVEKEYDVKLSVLQYQDIIKQCLESSQKNKS